MTNQTLKLDELGNVDVDYYISIARQQRSEYIAQMAMSMKARIKSFFQMTLSKLSTSQRSIRGPGHATLPDAGASG